MDTETPQTGHTTSVGGQATEPPGESSKIDTDELYRIVAFLRINEDIFETPGGEWPSPYDLPKYFPGTSVGVLSTTTDVQKFLSSEDIKRKPQTGQFVKRFRRFLRLSEDDVNTYGPVMRLAPPSDGTESRGTSPGTPTSTEVEPPKKKRRRVRKVDKRS